MPDSTGACFTRTRLYNGTVRTDYDCLLIPYNRLLCNGDRNSNTSVYECCTDGNFCNENLSPTLFPPSSDSTNSSTPTNTVTSITPSHTTSASSSPSSVMVSTSSAIRPTPLPGECKSVLLWFRLLTLWCAIWFNTIVPPGFLVCTASLSFVLLHLTHLRDA